MAEQHGSYYLPAPSKWPFIGSIGLFLFMLGFANWLHEEAFGPYLFFLGAIIVVYMIFGWFGEVIEENQKGLYDKQVDLTYRWSMAASPKKCMGKKVKFIATTEVQKCHLPSFSWYIWPIHFGSQK